MKFFVKSLWNDLPCKCGFHDFTFEDIIYIILLFVKLSDCNWYLTKKIQKVHTFIRCINYSVPTLHSPLGMQEGNVEQSDKSLPLRRKNLQIGSSRARTSEHERARRAVTSRLASHSNRISSDTLRTLDLIAIALNIGTRCMYYK